MTYPMTDDSELLRRYEIERSEEAFTQLVEHHLDFVYSCALRRVGGDTHLAHDVTQKVFIALAQSARALASRPMLVGWLFTTTRFASAQLVRTEQRRRGREQQIYVMNEKFTDDMPGATFDWETLRPLIDETLDELSEPDRNAVLLRFFEAKSFSEIGAMLKLNENAARMKVDRALHRLRVPLERRGISSTAGALGLALANQTATAIPAGMASSISSAALAGSALGIALPAIGIFMSSTKIALTAAVVALAFGSAVYEFKAKSEIDQERLALLVERDAMRAQLQTTSRQLQNETARAKAADEDNERLIKLVGPIATKKPSPQSSAPSNNPSLTLPIGVTAKPPSGWGKNGSKPDAYLVGEDSSQMLNGVPSAYISALDPDVKGFGGMMQMGPPGDLAGKRVRFSGWMKAEDAVQGGHLWLRIDGQAADGTPQFDNMNGRAPTGTTGWQQYSVVLDVPPEAKAVAYGMFLDGAGKMWVNSTKLEVVGDDVPSTNMRKKKVGSLN